MLPHFLARLTSALPSPVKYKLKNLRPAYTRLMQLGQSRLSVQTIAGPLNWEIDELTSQQFILGTYEPYMQEEFAQMIRPGFTVYDVGAHAGYHSLTCGLLVGPTGRVFAFEPNPLNRQSIERQLAVNPTLPVTIIPYAASDECGNTRLNTAFGSGQGRICPDGDMNVESRTIDHLVKDESLPSPNLMKIDVEGHEERVLKGALWTIRKYRPVILCDYNDGETLSIVEKLIGSLGYKVSGGSLVTGIPVQNRER